MKLFQLQNRITLEHLLAEVCCIQTSFDGKWLMTEFTRDIQSPISLATIDERTDWTTEAGWF